MSAHKAEEVMLNVQTLSQFNGKTVFLQVQVDEINLIMKKQTQMPSAVHSRRIRSGKPHSRDS